MFIITAVMAMKYLVFHFYGFGEHVGTGSRSWFDIPTVPAFTFMEHGTFYFCTSKKFMAGNIHMAISI
jgi:hypothetical protein